MPVDRITLTENIKDSSGKILNLQATGKRSFPKKQSAPPSLPAKKTTVTTVSTRFPKPGEALTSLGSSTIAGADYLGPVECYDPYAMALLYLATLADPLGTPIGAHIIDRFASWCNEANGYTASVALTIANGSGAYDGSTAFILRGDDYKTVTVPASISSGHAITWTGCTTYSTSPTGYSAHWFNHSIVHFALLRIDTFGLPHKPRVVSVRGPSCSYADMLAAAPTYTNVGLTSDQMGGEQSQSEDQLYFKSHRAHGDNEKLTWTACLSDRTVNGDEVVYVRVYGLQATDQVFLVYGGRGEYSGDSTIVSKGLGSLGAVPASVGAADLVASGADSLSNGKNDTQLLSKNADSTGGWWNKAYSGVKQVIQSEAAKDWLKSGADAMAKAMGGGKIVTALESLVPWANSIRLPDLTNNFLLERPKPQRAVADVTPTLKSVLYPPPNPANYDEEKEAPTPPPPPSGNQQGGVAVAASTSPTIPPARLQSSSSTPSRR